MKDNNLPSQIRELPEYLPQPISNGRELASGFEDQEVPLREIWRVVVKYKFIIASASLLAVLLGVVYLFIATPEYSAQAKVRISTYEPVLTATKIEDLLQEKSKESNYLETQIQEMRSYTVADRVLQDPEVLSVLERVKPSLARNLESQSAPLAEQRYRFPLSIMDQYMKMVEINPVKRTALVGVQVTAREPEAAAFLANKHAAAYIDWVRASRVTQQSSGLKFLRGQADELREKVADLEREMADYAEANSIVALNKDENITVQKMSQLNKLMTDATAKRVEAENVYKEAEGALASRSAGSDDSSIQSMRADLTKLQSEYSLLGEKFTPKYPKMQQLKSQIDQLESSILTQRKQIVTGLKARWQASLEEEKTLKEELEKQKSGAFELSKKQVEYNVLNRELTSSRDLLENVLKQIKETSLSVESNASNVSIVDYAIASTKSTYPRKGLTLGLALALGLISGIAGSFLLHYLDNTVRTPEDLTSAVKLPALGVVPSFMSERKVAGKSRNGTNALAVVKSDGLPITFVRDPKSLASEAYRMIRTGVLLSQAGEPPRTILVTSAQSSEGKTTSSVNLAVSLASSGAKVLIIDADLRRPSLHNHFNLTRDLPGVVEVLTGQLPLEQVLIDGLVKGVTVIPCGMIPPNPAELLGSVEMLDLIRELSKRYDFVLLDSAPILPLTDSVILSRYVDGVILVIKGGTTPKKVAKDARAKLEAVGARVLGAILNDVDVTGGDYYYYNKYYYSYYDNGAAAPNDKAAEG